MTDKNAPPPDPDHVILRTLGALAELANAPLLLPKHRRELHRIVAALAPAASAARKMRITLDELVADAQESVDGTEQHAELRIVRLGCPTLAVVRGGLGWKG